MDDMDGLDFFGDSEIDGIGDLFDWDEWFSTEALMSDAIAAGTSAGGILLASAAIPWLSEKILPDTWEAKDKSRVRSAMGVLFAFIGGRALWRVDKRASAGFVGAVGGLAVAQLLASFVDVNVGFAALPEEEALGGPEDGSSAKATRKRWRSLLRPWPTTIGASSRRRRRPCRPSTWATSRTSASAHTAPTPRARGVGAVARRNTAKSFDET